MRLNVPLDAEKFDILKNPGATRLLDAAIHLLAQGGQVWAGHPGPRVDFTVANPSEGGKPIKVTVELLKMTRTSDHRYIFEALVPGHHKVIEITTFLGVGDGAGGFMKDREE